MCVEHLEDPLEADHRRHQVDASVRQPGQRLVHAGDEGGEGDERSGRHLPRDDEVGRRRRRSPPHRWHRRGRGRRRTPGRTSPSGCRRRARRRHAPRTRRPRGRWSPNSLTSIAPATLNRSVICVFIEALCCICWREMSCSRRPTRRAGMMNIGSTTSASRVSRHSRASIAISVVTSTTTLLTTLPSVLVTAVWAPTTSLFEPRDRRAGRRAGEERDRHPLDLGEQGPAEVVDQTLADARAAPALRRPAARRRRGRRATAAAASHVIIARSPLGWRRRGSPARRTAARAPAARRRRWPPGTRRSWRGTAGRTTRSRRSVADVTAGALRRRWRPVGAGACGPIRMR